MPNAEDKYLKSSFYEQLTEHAFISEVLQEAWFRFGEVVDVCRSEIDATGYDIMLECRGIIRHVQLKSSDKDSKAANQKVNIALSARPSGCIVWLFRKEDPVNYRIILKYRFFGKKPGRPLDLSKFRVARHTKGNSKGIKGERPNIRIIPKKEFVPIDDTKGILQKLFGLA
ncbi:MAG: hypothetical protein ACKVRP_02580 [Bacteroidota bacterium]